jgi:hypothetical protein
MKDEAQQPRPAYTRSPLYLIGQIDTLEPTEVSAIKDDVREMIVNMMLLLEEAEDELLSTGGYSDVGSRIARFLRGEELDDG